MDPNLNRSQQNDAVVEKGTIILRCISKKSLMDSCQYCRGLS